jgi:hypothetical protein
MPSLVVVKLQTRYVLAPHVSILKHSPVEGASTLVAEHTVQLPGALAVAPGAQETQLALHVATETCAEALTASVGGGAPANASSLLDTDCSHTEYVVRGFRPTRVTSVTPASYSCEKGLHATSAPLCIHTRVSALALAAVHETIKLESEMLAMVAGTAGFAGAAESSTMRVTVLSIGVMHAELTAR